MNSSTCTRGSKSLGIACQCTKPARVECLQTTSPAASGGEAGKTSPILACVQAGRLLEASLSKSSPLHTLKQSPDTMT